jgi:hypothetical protein
MELQGTNVKAGSLVKWAAKWVGTAAALLLLAFDASAQGQSRPPPDQGDGAGPQRSGQGPQRQQRGRGDGTGPQGMAPTARPAQFAADDAAAPRGGQMSKEERRQLRRDVDQAGRDLYPERRRGGRHQQTPPPLESAPVR